MVKFWFVLSSSNRLVSELVVCFVLVGVSVGESACSVKISSLLLNLCECLCGVVVIWSWSRVVCVGLLSMALWCNGQETFRWTGPWSNMRCPVFANHAPGYSANYDSNPSHANHVPGYGSNYESNPSHVGIPGACWAMDSHHRSLWPPY